MPRPQKLLVLTTGGTIAGNVARASAGTTDEDVLASVLKDAAGRLPEEWGVEVELDPHHVADVDSSDISPRHWMMLTEAIRDHYDAYDGFIVTHGTNTMAYTCAALSFALDNLGRPVVVTGSQVPYGLPGSDALINLENALRVAVYPEGPTPLRGVVCVFGSHIITGTRVKKSTEFDLDAFAPSSGSSLGRIGRTIDLNTENLLRHQSYLERDGRAMARRRQDLAVHADFDTHILSFTEFPGMLSEVFQACLEGLIEREQPLVHALIFRAFGAGDVSRNLRFCFEYLKERKIPVIVSTQAPSGTANFKVNRPGKELREKGLAIPAHDMSIEAATTKLAWLLARGVDYSEIGRAMEEDLHGEISRSAGPAS